MTLRDYDNPDYQRAEKLHAENEALKAKIALWAMHAESLRMAIWDQQDRIDALMAEYCPDEMTSLQRDRWAERQKPEDE